MNPARFALAVAAFAPLSLAQSVCLPLGEAGAVGCQSPNNAALTNGVVATGDVDFDYDDTTGLLTITVSNDSPDVAGETNPLITALGFNIPAGQVNAVSLVSQTAAAGATPNFNLMYSGSQTNNMGCLGSFDVELSVQGIATGIGNPNASAYSAPAVAIGPAVFELQLAGPGIAGLVSEDFTTGLSAGGNPSVAVAVKFQGGGVGGAESGWVSGGGVCCPLPAMTQGVGAGCAPAGVTVPTLTPIGAPMPGMPLGVDVASPSTPNAFGILVYGFSTTFNPVFNSALPIDLGQFGFTGCSLLVSSEFAVGVMLDGNGDATHSFQIPSLLKWCSREISFQYFGLAGNDLITSAGLTQTIGG